MKFYRLLLKFNFIPAANLKLSEKLKTEFLGLKFNHPIGLGPGIDNTGSLISNLNALGFEFIEIGPVVDESDADVKGKQTEFILDNTKQSIFLKNNENLYLASQSLINIQSEIYKILSKSNNKKPSSLSLSTNIKISNTSARTVPYMADTLFINMLKNSILLSDFVCINFSSYTHKSLYQYKNMSKLEIFLNKIKDEMYYDIGIKSVLDYESHLVNTNPNDIKISNYLNYPIHLFKKERARLFLRLDIDISTEELKNIIELVKKNKIIDGLVIGGMSKVKDENIFICGEKNRERSLELLKMCRQYAKEDLAIISTGGILNAQDVYERLKYGADFVLIYTPFILQGPYCLEKITKELEDIMTKEGKNRIGEIRI